jgi:two-component system, OmpR family, phosphate regulon sensor histidine kinase PhoR
LVSALAIVFGLVAIVITYFLVGRMIRPLSDLLECSRAIARGDYTHRVHVLSRDELGMLALAFNHMQQQLASQVSRLEENSERLETVLGSMREGVLAVDNQQRVLFANEASRTMLGIRPGDIVGRPLVEATRVRPVHEAVEYVLRNNETLESEFESTASRRRIMAMRAARLPGDPTPGAVLVLHDISELRRLENLRHEFVANVSHELKTPLASIKAYAETLRLGAIDDPDHNLEFVGRIEEQGERLHQLIVDLLHIARVESGEEAFEIGPIDVAQVVQRVEPYFRRAAEEKHLTLQIEPPEQRLLVAADDDGLRTIVDNLVTNAIRYTPEGGSVTVRWRREEGQCVIEIEDTGIGIAPEAQTRIFERFYRVDKARSRELGGTGLGLAIVKHLTQAFNGSIGVVSQLKHGSLFRVRLPLVEELPQPVTGGGRP